MSTPGSVGDPDLYSRQRARHSLFHTVRFRAVSQAATVLSYIVLVRGMRQQDFGVYNLFYSFIPIITTLASFGLEQSLRRFQPEYLRAGRPAASEWLFKWVAAGRFATTVLMVGIVLAAWNLIAPRFHVGNVRVDFAIFGVLAILYLQSFVLQYSLASRMLHRYSVGSVAVISVGKLIAYAGICALGSLTLRGAITADIAAYAAGCAVLLVARRREGTGTTREVESRPDPGERRRLVRYAVFNHLNDASSLLVYGQTDNFFIGGMLSPVAVATYAFYGKLIEMIGNVLPQKLFDNIIQPLFFSVPAPDAGQRLPKYFTLLVDLNLAVQLPAIAFVAVYHHDIVTLFFGGKYAAYSGLFPLVMVLAIVPSSLSVPISLIAQYYERTGLMLASELFGIYQVAAMLLLVPAFGLYGAALATGSFNALRNLWVWWRLRAHVRWLNVWGVTKASLIIWGPLIAVCGALRSLLPHVPPAAHLAIGVCVCALGVLAFLRSAGISESDRQILASVMHGREGRALHWLGLMPSALAPQLR
ncbi:MAG TPA: lipopolysaccharide biosynthesis protein [Steroidobacteraceae bacterium]|jgi:O-antigen/teichoic acid export membrane protein|nr:lipopolysaccharide biosynthesis protein [Steroidobacteraceae bacterium]